MRHDFNEGKHTIINDNGKLTALRYGQPWERDLTGDNLIYWMLIEVDKLKQQLDALLGHCPDGECLVCGEIICPHGDSMHFHHDGCPSCAEDDDEDPICSGCNGCGEGMHDGSRCRNCKGTGVEPAERRDEC